EAAFALERFAKAFAFDHRHHEIRNALALADLIDRDDVRMPEFRDRFGLALKSLQQVVGDHEVVPQRLHRHLALAADVERRPHLGESAAAEETTDLEAFTERALESVTMLGTFLRRLRLWRPENLRGRGIESLRRRGAAARAEPRRFRERLGAAGTTGHSGRHGAWTVADGRGSRSADVHQC